MGLGSIIHCNDNDNFTAASSKKSLPHFSSLSPFYNIINQVSTNSTINLHNHDGSSGIQTIFY